MPLIPAPSNAAVLGASTDAGSAPAGRPRTVRRPEGGGANQALVVRDVRKHFGSLKVLQGIDFTAPAQRAGQPGRAERRRQDDSDALHQRMAQSVASGLVLINGPRHRDHAPERVRRFRRRAEVSDRDHVRNPDRRACCGLRVRARSAVSCGRGERR